MNGGFLPREGAILNTVVNCLVHIVCGLISYCHQPKKPSIALDHNLLPSP